MGRSFRLLLPLAGLVTLGACSLLNSPADEKQPGVGGGSGGSGDCGDCGSLDDDCNVGVCTAGKCEKQPKKEGTKCDDGDFCTDGDSCHAGKCVGGEAHACKGPDDCHPGACDSAAQKCKPSTAPDDTPCDDGNPCDEKGACMSGKCQRGPTKCNKPPYETFCGTGICVDGVGCDTTPKNEHAGCTDGIAPECATGICTAGKCVGTKIDGSDMTPCDSGKFCLVGTACLNGECIGGVKRTCPSSDPCSPASCDEVGDLCTIKRKPDGSACNDGDLCHVGMTCKTGACQHPTKTIGTCVDGDKCCPAGNACSAEQDNDCFYWKSGVQQSVELTELLGWQRCFIDTYDQSTATISAMMAACDGDELLMGCGQYDAAAADVVNLQLAAMGKRADVFRDCSDTSVCGCYDFSDDVGCVPAATNGVGFYFAPALSFGFARGGDPIRLNSCDYPDYMALDATSPFRMCVHRSGVDGISSGFRCGEAEGLGANYARVIYKSSVPIPH